MEHSSDPAPTLATIPVGAPPAGQLPLIAATELFRQGTTLRIFHAGQVYQLRLTRENRLILTK